MKSTLITAVALSGALALAGCGSSGSTSAPSSSGGSAASSSTTSNAPAATAGSTLPSGDLGARISEAMIAARSGKGTLSTEGGPATQALTGNLEFVFVDEKTTEMHGTMSVGGQSLEIVTKGSVFYLKGVPAQMGGGKPWVKIDPSGTDPISKSMSRLGANAGDPRAMLDAFKGGTATVVDSSGGMTHYRIADAKVSGATTSVIDVTTDARDLPSNFTVAVQGTTIKVDYTDWGSGVTITEPPADQVGSVSMPTG